MHHKPLQTLRLTAGLLALAVVSCDPLGGDSASLPWPPREARASAEDGRATVSWITPLDGGGGIRRYEVTAVEDTTVGCVAVRALTCTVTGLSARRTYSFVVRARNAAGVSGPSEPTPSVVSLRPLPDAAPEGLTATALSGGARVSWTSPAPGVPVQVRAVQDTARTCVADADSSCLIPDLSHGTLYAFEARAFNETGPGPWSPTTAPAIGPLPGPPGAPRSVAAVAGDTQATVSWAAPLNDGGSPVTGYEVTSLNGLRACMPPAGATSCVVGNLQPNASVIFRVRAVNAFGPGTGVNSSAVVPFFIAQVPGPPRNLSVAVGNSQVTVSWLAPASSGAGPITGYRVSVANTTVRCTTTGLSCTLSGLTNGTNYPIAVVAMNAAGAGPSALTYGRPAAP